MEPTVGIEFAYVLTLSILTLNTLVFIIRNMKGTKAMSEEDIMHPFNNGLIKRRMKEKGLTQLNILVELSNKSAPVSPGTLGRWITGKGKPSSEKAKELRALGEILDIKFEDFFKVGAPND